MAQHTSQPEKKPGLLRSYLAQQVAQQDTAKTPASPLPPPTKDALILPATPIPDEEEGAEDPATMANDPVEDELEQSLPLQAQAAQKRSLVLRLIALTLVLVLASLLYFTWRTDPLPAPIPAVTPQNFSSSITATTDDNLNTQSSAKGTIVVYIVGAVKRPGVYILATNARVYALLQAAGGPLPKANLVALNLAARLNDGQEVYVPVIGELLPTYHGGVPTSGSTPTSNTTTDTPVNINTASTSEMQQILHISSTTAQNIADYRTQHGPFTSVDQLLQIMSKTTYDKIKNLVTV